MDNIEIRKAKVEEYEKIVKVFLSAKAKMVKDGNIHQWADEDYPLNLVRNDLANQKGYVLVKNNAIHAYFFYNIGIDPTYNVVYGGSWKNDNTYLTIHRIASDGEIKNVFKTVLDYLIPLKVDIRIDTHKDNKRMMHILTKNNFHHVGVIKIPNVGDREAYHYINK